MLECGQVLNSKGFWVMKQTSNKMNLTIDGLDKSEEWTESFTDKHPTKPHPAPGDTCQDEWQKLSNKT